MSEPAYQSLPFDEQIEFFRQKLHLPTARWDDIWQSAHDKAFVVAGALQADLLADLHGAVAKAIEQGATLETFRKDFDRIVEKRGWTGWTGEGSAAGVAWRTRVIWDTNLRTSYNAGRWAQVQAVKAHRPYLIYRHNDSVLNPRPHHVAWDGAVLPADDPWVLTHWTPNGWGCKCKWFALSEADLQRMGKAGPDAPPPADIDPKTGAPVGIDKGWGYAPGASWTPNYGKYPQRLADELRERVASAPAATLRQAVQDLDEEQKRASVHTWIESRRTKNPVALKESGMGEEELFFRVTWEGIDFFFPDNPAPEDGPGSAITRQIERMAAAEKYPRRLKAATRRVVLTAQPNQYDDYWAERYDLPGFRSAATGGRNATVHIYNAGTLSAQDLAHEMGHNLATHTWQSTAAPSSSDYAAAIASAEPPVSAYASASPAEDFAEAVELYYRNKAQLKATAPRRYAVIDRLLRDPDYGG
jgi:hypothetical protein